MRQSEVPVCLRRQARFSAASTRCLHLCQAGRTVAFGLGSRRASSRRAGVCAAGAGGVRYWLLSGLGGSGSGSGGCWSGCGSGSGGGKWSGSGSDCGPEGGLLAAWPWRCSFQRCWLASRAGISAAAGFPGQRAGNPLARRAGSAERVSPSGSARSPCRNGRLVVSARVRGVVLHGLHAAGGQGALGAARQEPPGRVVSAQGSVEVGQRQAAGECVPVLAGA